MQYWLIKSEPSTYSIDQMKEDKTTCWSGVRNYAARNNLRDMKKGDICFFYHSVKDPGVVGLVKVTKVAYPDPTTEETAWVAVDVQFLRKMKSPVSLKSIKENDFFKQMDLIKYGRLSVQKVTEEEYEKILLMGE